MRRFVFPAQPVQTALPVLPGSQYASAIGRQKYIHPDFPSAALYLL
jgi:hypothetical protein